LRTHHVHRPATAVTLKGLSNLMKKRGQCHIQRINRTYRRTGSLWEGCFQSCLVQADSYLLAGQRLSGVVRRTSRSSGSG
jgi:putative transposase